jgi:glycosyltransferase involved in cell wall biosynthesis
VVGSDETAGILVPPRNPEAMAAAIRAVLDEPGRAERMGRAARQRVQRLFQWDQAAAGLIEVFEETIHAAHRRSRAA